jgi:DNA-directed RNA polymerase subunit RPC12/RpoP
MKSMRKRLQAGIAALEKNGGSSDKLTILYRQMRKVGWKIVFLERYPEKYDGTTCLRCGKKVATAVLQETPEALFCPHCQKLLAGSAGADIKFGEEPGDKYRLSLEEVAA